MAQWERPVLQVWKLQPLQHNSSLLKPCITLNYTDALVVSLHSWTHRGKIKDAEKNMPSEPSVVSVTSHTNCPNSCFSFPCTYTDTNTLTHTVNPPTHYLQTEWKFFLKFLLILLVLLLRCWSFFGAVWFFVMKSVMFVKDENKRRHRKISSLQRWTAAVKDFCIFTERSNPLAVPPIVLICLIKLVILGRVWCFWIPLIMISLVTCSL